MTKKGRKRISEAMKKRWALLKEQEQASGKAQLEVAQWLLSLNQDKKIGEITIAEFDNLSKRL